MVILEYGSLQLFSIGYFQVSGLILNFLEVLEIIYFYFKQIRDCKIKCLYKLFIKRSKIGEVQDLRCFNFIIYVLFLVL